MDPRIRKGTFDNTIYRKDILGVYDSIPVSAPFRDNFKLTTEQNTEYGLLDPIQMPFSRQIYKPDLTNKNLSHTPNFYKLGDPYNPPHGSNLNGPLGKPQQPYTAYDLIDNDVTELLKNMDKFPTGYNLFKKSNRN